MSDKFSNLRMATRSCIEQLGASRNEELFEFRNAATFVVIHELLREYDRLREQAAAPVVTHSLGTLTADEAAVVEALRQVDDEHKMMIRIAADVAVQGEAERQAKDRCEVVDLAIARRSQGQRLTGPEKKNERISVPRNRPRRRVSRCRPRYNSVRL